MYRGCSLINRSALNFNGRIDIGESCLTLCCESVQNRPACGFEATARETIEGFMKMRADLVAESKREKNGHLPGRRIFTKGCANCANFLPGKWDGDGLIHYVNLSMYPAPCQCKCIYCGVHSGENGVFKRDECGEYYEKMFDALDYGCQNGLIAPNAVWQVSSGEIAIHPYKDRIFRLVKNQRAFFYTNCFIFDEGIAQSLSTNSGSAINLSIDSGTPQTWFRIKGVDNFEQVTDNLVKYYAASLRPGQITLKYIVLPGINDNLQDYMSVIEIMKILGVRHLTIARDTRKKYDKDTGQLEDLLGASGYFLAMLYKSKFTADMFTFSLEEREKAIAFANELLQTGEV